MSTSRDLRPTLSTLHKWALCAFQGDEGGLSSALQDALPVVLAYGQQEMDMVVGEVLPSASGRYVLLNGWCDEVG